ncbi:hypothetical protein DACRYDRAFT_24973 [Dacryopinax primogenitus]|uniref:HSF-type DNA-binding domain-containing protein n=1 Tax=Dacryopinax primogenitus (strain DJM 731) TaxID=1858805 RepID=M5FW45_DACPD|nr:uncharacterized protein DACRYDRAFT_24973 [Dacryopinax primogenitus]EJT97591.1 hypothetical protein DACRYDRAFT_24973 [Dacryopinax primogenitus]
MDYQNSMAFSHSSSSQQSAPQHSSSSSVNAPAPSMYPLQPVAPRDDDLGSSPEEDNDGEHGGSSSQQHDENGDPSLSPGGSKKSQPKAQTSFLTKLYDLLEKPEYQSMIRWDATGEHIIVERPEMLALHVLPSVYRQSRFASFTRQLNIYGFFRKANLRNLNPGIEDPDASTWSHPTLRRSSRGTDAVTNFKRRVQDRKPKGRKKMSPPGHGQPGLPGAHPGMQPGGYPQTASRPGTGMMPQGLGMQGNPAHQNRARAYTQPSLHVNTRPMSSHGPLSAGPGGYGSQQPSWNGAYPQQSQNMHSQYPNATYNSGSSYGTSPTDDPTSPHYQSHQSNFSAVPSSYPGSSYQQQEPPQNPNWPSFPNAGSNGQSLPQQGQNGHAQSTPHSNLSSLLNPAGYSRPGTATGAPPIAIQTQNANGSFSNSPYTNAMSPAATRPGTAYSTASSMPGMSYDMESHSSVTSTGPASAGPNGPQSPYDYRPRSSHANQQPLSNPQQHSMHPLSRPNTSIGAGASPGAGRPRQASGYSAYPLRPLTAPGGGMTMDMNGQPTKGLMGMQMEPYASSPTTADFAHSIPVSQGNEPHLVRPSTGHSSLSARSRGSMATPTPADSMSQPYGHESVRMEAA